MNDDSNDPRPEQELWDDDATETPKVTHKGCGGRIVWISGEEHRCWTCGNAVSAEEMDMPDEQLFVLRIEV